MDHKLQQDKMFVVLVREHHRRLLAYAFSLVRRKELAEDLVQNALLAAYRKISDFEPSRDFGSWVRGMVRLEYLNWVRRRREIPLEPGVLDTLEHRHAHWDAALHEHGIDPFAALEHCLQRLQEPARRLVDDFYRRRLDCHAIGGKAGASAQTIRKRLERTRRFLQACITATLNADTAIPGTGDSPSA
ncbi:MAG: sigma-70 family RNA polymerase sigma factor [Kiritimatiellae bacterium]|nr:sigma-70 family RNA polymerase sigma factor [Kiritimatiellia bacterium]